MSRVGKAPINIPEGVTVSVNKNTVNVKGPKGELFQQIDTDIQCKVENGTIILDRPTDQKRHKSMHGLYRSLVNNMVEGVKEGYKKELELVGVGYKASAQNNILELNVGYSHSIYFAVPEDISVTAVTEKGKNPLVTIEGIDKQLVGEVAAKIKSIRKVEPYKGKGIRSVGEQIRRKAGKTATK
ncbi:MAG: 50S ribosomal protein L6 [Bacteroidota bacterium]